MVNYKDITVKWIKNANPNSHEVEDRLYYIDDKGVKYKVDGKNVVLDYTKKEKEVAVWLENTFGGKIFMLPRINKPWNVKTPDYLFRNEYWDLKEISASGKRAIDNRINGTKKQTKNYILDVTNSILSDEEIIYQIKRLYDSNDRKWVEKIILIRNYKLIIICKRKKDCPPAKN